MLFSNHVYVKPKKEVETHFYVAQVLTLGQRSTLLQVRSCKEVMEPRSPGKALRSRRVPTLLKTETVR